ncbi:MAG: LytTR family transcriptional regulator [Bacteroidales bacterium]|mgnify:CR=1 FL=1|nr:LytTR family transcriptional regulator [Bacteroidales bacterium]
MEIKPSYLPKIFLKFEQQIVHFLTIPIFLFLFLILYKPFNLPDLLTLKYGGFAFNCAMIMCIMFLVLLVSRLLLWGVRNVTDFKRRTYFLWCASEIVISSFFIAMYVTLVSGGHYVYIDVLPKVITTLSGIVVFPYLILSLLLESDFLARYNMEAPEDLSKIRFYDDKHNLKFVADSRTVLYIESHENYCSIFYTEGGKVKNFLLRGTMKRMEDECSKYGILRCHRSYFVNVGRVKVLRKEREGYNVAELDVPGIESIPITPRYYQAIAEKV